MIHFIAQRNIQTFSQRTLLFQHSARGGRIKNIGRLFKLDTLNSYMLIRHILILQMLKQDSR